MIVQTLKLRVLPHRYALCKLDAGAPIPEWVGGGDFVSITKSADELSIIDVESGVPVDVESDRGWRCLKVDGPLAFTMIGILASLATPLADGGISLLSVSTYDTDYLLVKEANLDDALAILRREGHQCLQP